MWLIRIKIFTCASRCAYPHMRIIRMNRMDPQPHGQPYYFTVDPKAQNPLESWNSCQFKTWAQTSLQLEAFKPIYSIHVNIATTAASHRTGQDHSVTANNMNIWNLKYKKVWQAHLCGRSSLLQIDSQFSSSVLLRSFANVQRSFTNVQRSFTDQKINWR